MHEVVSQVESKHGTAKAHVEPDNHEGIQGARDIATALLEMQRTHGNRHVHRLLNTGLLQAKLRVSEPRDPDEQEADRVADQVMRMDVSDDTHHPHLQRACAQCEDDIQRQAVDEDEDKLHRQVKDEEEEGMQRQAGAEEQTVGRDRREPSGSEVSGDWEARVETARGSGRSLPETTRAFFEPRFGYDFSQVRIHADSQAAEAARAVKALAFTIGRDVVFDAGQYSPDSAAGKRLLAHELTHVVQQGGAVQRKRLVGTGCEVCQGDSLVRSHALSVQRQVGESQIEDQLVRAFLEKESTVQRNINRAQPVDKEEEEEKRLMRAKSSNEDRGVSAPPVTIGPALPQPGQEMSTVQRRIVVGGKPYIPTASYSLYLNNNFGPHMEEFVNNMHNGGNPPDYTFSSYEQMGFEIRVRNEAIKGMSTIHAGCCNYYDSANPPYLNATYWDQVGSGVRFQPKSPLPPGKEASDAIEAIFAPGAGTRVECLSMTAAVEYYSMLKGLGKAKFNSLFPGGAGLEISASPSRFPASLGAGDKYKIIAVASKSEILPGDWVYFQNFSDYTAKHPGGYWQGENAVYLGGGKYRGFGVAAMYEADMNAELVKQYNDGLPVADQKTDLLAAGGGLLLSPVVRPQIAKLVP